MSLVVHINGWPGVGKLTIARLLAGTLNARLLDNHTLINPAEAMFARTDPAYYSFRADIRALAFKRAAQLPQGVNLVLTDAIAQEEPRHHAMFADCVTLADRLGAKLISVVLDCAAEENARRLVDASRRELRKLDAPDILAEIRRTSTLLRPEGVPRFDLDVTHLTADEAAARIADRVSGLAGEPTRTAPAGS